MHILILCLFLCCVLLVTNTKKMYAINNYLYSVGFTLHLILPITDLVWNFFFYKKTYSRDIVYDMFEEFIFERIPLLPCFFLNFPGVGSGGDGVTCRWLWIKPLTPFAACISTGALQFQFTRNPLRCDAALCMCF